MKRKHLRFAPNRTKRSKRCRVLTPRFRDEELRHIHSCMAKAIAGIREGARKAGQAFSGAAERISKLYFPNNIAAHAMLTIHADSHADSNEHLVAKPYFSAERLIGIPLMESPLCINHAAFQISPS